MNDTTQKRIAVCLDACKGMSTDLLENILIMGDTIASRFELRDKTERELTNENDTLRARIAELEAAAVPVQAIPETVIKYVPVDSKLRTSNGNHPNDDEPQTEACKKSLNDRGDDQGQGLDGYWKWGFRAGFNAALSAAPTPSSQSPVAEPQWEVKEGTESSWRDMMPGDFGLYQALCRRCPDRYQMRIKSAPIPQAEPIGIVSHTVTNDIIWRTWPKDLPDGAKLCIQPTQDAGGREAVKTKPNTKAMRKAIARAIWSVQREVEDRCDQALEDLSRKHYVWDEADAVIAAIQAKGEQA